MSACLVLFQKKKNVPVWNKFFNVEKKMKKTAVMVLRNSFESL